MLTPEQLAAAIASPACVSICAPFDPSNYNWSVEYYETDGLQRPTFAALPDGETSIDRIIWGNSEVPVGGCYTVIWGSLNVQG
jgi:hypothetical protein